MKENIELFSIDRFLVGQPEPVFYLEILIRVIVVFAMLLGTLKFLGKRGQRSLTPMQQILLIAIGSAAGDATFYPDVPLLYVFAVLLIITLTLYAINYLKRHSSTVDRLLHSRPLIIVENGSICEKAEQEEQLTEREIYALLRSNGIRFLEQVDCAILEADGSVSVFKNEMNDSQARTSLIQSAKDRIA